MANKDGAQNHSPVKKLCISLLFITEVLEEVVKEVSALDQLNHRQKGSSSLN